MSHSRHKGQISALLVVAIVGLSAWIHSSSPIARADIGVGVGLGHISVNEALSPGGRYNLPLLPVLNTGSDEGQYEVALSYAAEQREKRPPSSWFNFSPQNFHLLPTQSQPVAIVITVPTNAEPGDYFAFLEAHPIIEREGVSIGVAAATKLSFSVYPANALQAWLVRVSHLIEDSQPWSSIIAIGPLAYLAIAFMSRYVRIGVRLERK